MRITYIVVLPFLLFSFGNPTGESADGALAKKATAINITAKIEIPKLPKLPNEIENKEKTTSKNTKKVKQDNTSKQKKPINHKQETPVKVKSKQNSPVASKSSPSSTDSSNILAIEREVVRLVNIERAKKGLQPLKISEKLSKVARTKSQDMKDNHYFSHESPTYGSPFDMLKHFGVSYQTAGENIAAGQPTAAAVVDGWMNSQGHRENILHPSYTHIGVGYVSGGDYGTYWTQLFTG
jgi:uncharacterized YkwD family protein